MFYNNTIYPTLKALEFFYGSKGLLKFGKIYKPIWRELIRRPVKNTIAAATTIGANELLWRGIDNTLGNGNGEFYFPTLTLHMILQMIFCSVLVCPMLL